MKNDFQKNYNEFKMKISSGVFSAYFQDEEDFEIFLAKLSEKEQEKFFRLSRFYSDFVRNSLFENEDIKNYFSLIMIFSLIEATMSEEKHLTFDEYLSKNFIPVPDKNTLERIKKEYFIEFGLQGKVKKFFDNVDEECKKIFAHAIINSKNQQKTLSIDKSIEQNINLFYNWRSKFVHNAEIPGAFQESSFCMEDKNIIITAYAKEDFEQLFEHGFLRYFGYTKNFKHKNTEEKIKRYKNHTFSAVWKKIINNFESLNKKINQ